MNDVSLDFSRLTFESPEIPDRRWLEWFHDEYSRQLFRIEIEPSRDTSFRFDTTTRVLPDLAIARSFQSPMRVWHRGDSNDDISMIVPLEGCARVEINGQSHELRAGMGFLGRHDNSAVVDVPTSTQMLGIRLRRKLIEPLLPDFAAFSVSPDTEAMRLLLGYVRMIEAGEAIASPEVRQLVTTHVHDLVALAFGVTRDREALIGARGKRAGRLAAIKQDILSNLADPTLSVGKVARRQGLTPRYIHKIFEAHGASFSEFVVGQRLERVHRMLCDRRFDHLSISDIALHVGFGDLSYFNRTFRRRFEATPSEVRAEALRR